ncbi:MAG TPA: allantoate amidohydrolase [Actinocrinis sp.]|uniref:allantoate amidohydrolase n=1 Tax=Actinocrinis sp. TaxID=1920516 RepID=UPI002DDCD4DA|nr:allantoate amidohydrolase [Actinocrinis sp.]HEV2346545.1 allantoate amidohydrolase [Actinocrinis sp.]
MSEVADATGFAELWSSLEGIGRDGRRGGYQRFAWTSADLACRDWFTSQAADRGLTVETDRNGNQWAWWLPRGGDRSGALAVGSHLDSVPCGGAYDGPLGVISALAAVDLLRARGLRPSRPVAIANFADEEGARFGIACTGSRLMTGQLGAAAARELRDGDGVRLADAMEAAGQDPESLGPDDERLSGIAQFVELHIEQGRWLVDHDAPVGVASSIWPHGRWRFDFTGEANHAGTTALNDRRDPMLTYAHTVLSARKKARLGGALATFGRIRVEPNGTNAIPSRVQAWLDGRAPDEATLSAVVGQIIAAADERGERDGTRVEVVNESRTAIVEFDDGLRDRISETLAGTFGRVPQLPTGAGHDAGILAARVPAAMLFVRNPSGLSHAPAEHADTADCLAGVAALAEVMADLAGAGPEGTGG